MVEHLLRGSINTRAQCKEFIANCRYAPKGRRSFGPTRALWYAGGDYAKHANDTVITMAMIETQEAMDNLDAILSTPGLDAIDLCRARRPRPLPGGDSFRRSHQ